MPQVIYSAKRYSENNGIAIAAVVVVIGAEAFDPQEKRRHKVLKRIRSLKARRKEHTVGQIGFKHRTGVTKPAHKAKPRKKK